MMTITSPQTKLVSNKAQALKRIALVASVSVAALLTGCATTTATGSANPADPLESMNRSIYSFNEGLDSAVFKPVATAYQTVTPRVAREGWLWPSARHWSRAPTPQRLALTGRWWCRKCSAFGRWSAKTWNRASGLGDSSNG